MLASLASEVGSGSACAEGKRKQGRARTISGDSAVVGQGEFRQLALAVDKGCW